jgi:Flp pilus assembly protein protease CpaA
MYIKYFDITSVSISDKVITLISAVWVVLGYLSHIKSIGMGVVTRPALPGQLYKN